MSMCFSQHRFAINTKTHYSHSVHLHHTNRIEMCTSVIEFYVHVRCVLVCELKAKQATTTHVHAIVHAVCVHTERTYKIFFFFFSVLSFERALCCHMLVLLRVVAVVVVVVCCMKSMPLKSDYPFHTYKLRYAPQMFRSHNRIVSSLSFTPPRQSERTHCHTNV